MSSDVVLLILGAAVAIVTQSVGGGLADRRQAKRDREAQQRAIERTKREAAETRTDLACEKLDAIFSDLEVDVPAATLNSTDDGVRDAYEKRQRGLDAIGPQAAYLEAPVRERLLELHEMLYWAGEVSRHKYNSQSKHYDHITTYCTRVVKYGREVIAAALQRKPMPTMPDQIVEYRVSLEANFDERRHDYQQEQYEWEQTLHEWKGANPGIDAAIRVEKDAHDKYLAGRED